MLVLLRGVNVSGHNKVPMAELRAALTDAGLDNVATYIQSGNIAVDWADDPNGLLDRVARVLAESFDVHVPAVVVDRDAVQLVVDDAPFAPDADPRFQVVFFAGGTVDVEAVAAIDSARFPGDDITASRRAVYVSFENGQGSSKLTLDTLERAAGCTLTGRNLRSTERLLSL